MAFVNDTVFHPTERHDSFEQEPESDVNKIADPFNAEPPKRIPPTPPRGEDQGIRVNDMERDTKLLELFAERQNDWVNDQLRVENRKLKKLVIGLIIFSIAQATIFGAHVMYSHGQKSGDLRVAHDVKAIEEKIDLMSNKVE